MKINSKKLFLEKITIIIKQIQCVGHIHVTQNENRQ